MAPQKVRRRATNTPVVISKLYNGFLSITKLITIATMQSLNINNRFLICTHIIEGICLCKWSVNLSSLGAMSQELLSAGLLSLASVKSNNSDQYIVKLANSTC